MTTYCTTCRRTTCVRAGFAATPYARDRKKDPLYLSHFDPLGADPHEVRGEGACGHVVKFITSARQVAGAVRG